MTRRDLWGALREAAADESVLWPAVDRLRDAIPFEYDPPCLGGWRLDAAHPLSVWNDKPDRHEHEILRLLDAVAEATRGEDPT